jgi:hypothetical protein
MAIKILNTGAPRSGDAEDDPVVGEFKNGRQVNGKPESLDFWIIRTDDPEVADSLAEFYGVEVVETDYERKPFQVELDKGTDITLQVDYLRTAMILKSQSTWKEIRKCDGETMTDGDACKCAVAYGANSKDFWEASKDGLACKPDGLIFGRIVGLETLGKFILSKNSRSTVSQFDKLEEAAEDAGLSTPYVTEVSIDTIEGKAHTWTVPAFSPPEAVA